ncbi:ferritin-like domain-containing protein [Streptomyces sp. NPDC088812]|uniref:ferritin-like domain-containing protein n=1 Tax=Streptomyces sp. NPDC088812 TaxID=3365905 RepID=UPI0038167CFC
MTEPTPIARPAELKAALQLAVGLRLGTIPVHLTALCSVRDGHNTEAVRVVRGAVMREMLHMTLAANVLNALGGTPSPEPVAFQGHEHLSPLPPGFPTDSPVVPGLGTLELLPLSPRAVDALVRIARPRSPGAPSAAAPGAGGRGHRTVGAFHHAIATALEDPEICPDAMFRHRGQVPDTQYYGGAGRVVEVHDRASALKAIRTVVDGDGCLPPRAPEVFHALEVLHAPEVLNAPEVLHAPEVLPVPEALRVPEVLPVPEREPGQAAAADGRRSGRWTSSSYARLRELQAGRRFLPGQSSDEEPGGAPVLVDYGAVHPALHLPGTGDTADGGPETAALVEFDLAYSLLVDGLYRAFAGEPQALTVAVHGMYALKHRAVSLMRTPNPADPAHTLCPGFSYLPPGDREKAARQARELRQRNW